MATVDGTNGNDFIHVAGDGLVAPAGYADNNTATDGDDTINSGPGGSDIIHAGDGNDQINFIDDLDATDVIDGGFGFDTLVINDQTNIVFAAGSLSSIEEIDLPFLFLPVGFAGFQSITTNDANVGPGGTLIVNAGQLSQDTFFTFDGSAETNGKFTIYGGHGTDLITGGKQGDYFDLSTGGADTVTGGGGLDTFYFGDALTAGDTITGDAKAGGILFIEGSSYASGLTFSSTTMQNITQLILNTGYSYTLATDDGNLAAGQQLLVNGLEADTLNFDGSAETNGHFYIIGDAGADTLTGGARGDTFDLYAPPGLFGGGYGGGLDVVNGGAGNDIFLGATSDATIDGGAGFDTVYATPIGFIGLEVDYGPDSLHNVEKLIISNHMIVMNDGNVAAGATLLVQGSSQGFDGSGETDGHFHIVQTFGDGNWTGGALSDIFDIQGGSRIAVNGGGGNDIINAGAEFDTFDKFDGGGGTDTLNLDGDYSAGLVFSPTMLVNVEKLNLAAGHSYKLTTDDATVAAGRMLTVNAANLGAADNLILDASAETDGRLNVFGGAGADIFNFAATNLSGADTVTGGGGMDRLNFTTAGTIAASRFTHVSGIETIALANGANHVVLADALAGSANSHILTVTGNAGADIINGNLVTTAANKLHINGGAGGDTITGGSGADILTGGLGKDSMTGGGGADRFDFNAVAESGTTAAARDVIADFTIDPATGAAFIDRIDVATIDAMAATGGDQAFSFQAGATAFTAEGQIIAVQSGTSTLVEFNTSGTSGAEMIVVLANFTATGLSAADFIL